MALTAKPWYLPYPAGGERPDMPAALRALANGVQSTVNRHTKKALPVRSGMTGHATLLHTGCQVTLDWACHKNTKTKGKNVWICTVPKVLCPRYDITGASMAVGGVVPGVVFVPPKKGPAFYDSTQVSKATWDRLKSQGWKPLPLNPHRIYRPANWAKTHHDGAAAFYDDSKVSTARWDKLISQGWKPKPVNPNRIYRPYAPPIVGNGLLANSAVRFFLQRSTGFVWAMGLRNDGKAYLTGSVSWIVPFAGSGLGPVPLPPVFVPPPYPPPISVPPSHPPLPPISVPPNDEGED